LLTFLLLHIKGCGPASLPAGLLQGCNTRADYNTVKWPPAKKSFKKPK
jgi:hypothetical protein